MRTVNKLTGPIDYMLGERISQLRAIAGLTQKELADKVGISFQQLQKYEKGSNRISASRLLHIAKALGVPVGSIYLDIVLPSYKASKEVKQAYNLSFEQNDLLLSFAKFNPEVRYLFAGLMRALSGRIPT